MEVNLGGMLRVHASSCCPRWSPRRRGRILNLTSQAGSYRWPLVSAYSVSKAAVMKLTENLAHETSRYGVSVFSVHPGLLPDRCSARPVSPTPRRPTRTTGQVRTWVTPGARPRRRRRPEGRRCADAPPRRWRRATRSRAVTCRCTTTSTRCSTGSTPCATATSTSCAPNASSSRGSASQVRRVQRAGATSKARGSPARTTSTCSARPQPGSR